MTPRPGDGAKPAHCAVPPLRWPAAPRTVQASIPHLPAPRLPSPQTQILQARPAPPPAVRPAAAHVQAALHPARPGTAQPQRLATPKPTVTALPPRRAPAAPIIPAAPSPVPPPKLAMPFSRPVPPPRAPHVQTAQRAAVQRKPAPQKPPGTAPRAAHVTAALGRSHATPAAQAAARTARAFPSRALQCQVLETESGRFYSTHHPERHFTSRESAVAYDLELAGTAVTAFGRLATGQRASFHSVIATEVERSLSDATGSYVFAGEDPEDLPAWAQMRYTPITSDWQTLATVSPIADLAIEHVDLLGEQHRGILVDPTFIPARNRTGFRGFLEARDAMGSIFDAWQDFHDLQPTVTYFRGLNLPTASGLTAISGGEGLRPSLMRNALAGSPVSFDTLFNQPFGRQVIDRLQQNNVGNQMLQSVTLDPSIAWLVGSNPTFTGTQSSSTNSVFRLELAIPEMDLLRLDDFGPYSDEFSGFNYRTTSGTTTAWSNLDQVEQFAYLPLASTQIISSSQRSFSESFPGSHNWVKRT